MYAVAMANATSQAWTVSIARTRMLRNGLRSAGVSPNSAASAAARGAR